MEGPKRKVLECCLSPDSLLVWSLREGFTGSPCSGRIFVNESWNRAQLCRHHLINYKQAWGLEIMSPWGENYYVNHSACMLGRFCHVRLCNTMDCSPLDPLFMGFSRQEYWRGLPCPPPRDLPHPGIKTTSTASPALQMDSLPLSHPGSPKTTVECGKGTVFLKKNSTCYLAYLRRDRKPDSCEPLKCSEVINWADDLLLNPWQSREVLSIIDEL